MRPMRGSRTTFPSPAVEPACSTTGTRWPRISWTSARSPAEWTRWRTGKGRSDPRPGPQVPKSQSMNLATKASASSASGTYLSYFPRLRLSFLPISDHLSPFSRIDSRAFRISPAVSLVSMPITSGL